MIKHAEVIGVFDVYVYHKQPSDEDSGSEVDSEDESDIASLDNVSNDEELIEFRKWRLEMRNGNKHITMEGTSAEEGSDVVEGPQEFQVIGEKDEFVVDLRKKTCGCRYWNLIGILCSHAIFAIFTATDTPDKYVHPCYMVETVRQSYAEHIRPINGEQQWVKQSFTTLLPPKAKGTPGSKET
ncbi:hypothetical protein IFM89_031207 [Coptis chinensis]|uniref:SWIM-type domain-containing protein n=1 Tax=Coptis chinensis TaxID=261450 RepID=A0A835MCV1_9MAGN|nr:hypothetical protein IFM89_031207 [Coptis chinensis]